jgi:hypothetical protein
MKLSTALATLSIYSCTGIKPTTACVQKEDICNKEPVVAENCVAVCEPGLENKCPTGYNLEETITKPTSKECYDILPVML